MPKYHKNEAVLVAVVWNGDTTGIAMLASAPAVDDELVMAGELFAMDDPERRVEYRDIPCDTVLFLL